MWARVRPLLLNLGVKFSEYVTRRPGEATEVTREAVGGGIGRVVAVGGDGTLGEVVNGYLDDSGRAINLEAALGLLPSGTGSDFRRSLGLTTRNEALSALAGAHTRLLDAVRIDFLARDGQPASRLFLNLASFGLGGEAAGLVNRWRESLPRWVSGRARYVAAALRALARHRNVPIKVVLDEDREFSITSNLLVVANGRFAGGGMMLAPHAELDDGLLDVILTDRITRFDVIKELRRIGSGGHLNNPKVSETRGRFVSVTSEEPLAIDVDGEMVGYTPARLMVLPASVRLAVRVPAASDHP